MVTQTQCLVNTNLCFICYAFFNTWKYYELSFLIPKMYCFHHKVKCISLITKLITPKWLLFISFDISFSWTHPHHCRCMAINSMCPMTGVKQLLFALVIWDLNELNWNSLMLLSYEFYEFHSLSIFHQQKYIKCSHLQVCVLKHSNVYPIYILKRFIMKYYFLRVVIICCLTSDEWFAICDLWFMLKWITHRLKNWLLSIWTKQSKAKQSFTKLNQNVHQFICWFSFFIWFHSVVITLKWNRL